MKSISIKLPDGLATRLEKRAKQQGISKSELLREALEQALADADAINEAPSAYDLIKSDIGVVDSAPQDLSTNPKHLEGYGR